MARDYVRGKEIGGNADMGTDKQYKTGEQAGKQIDSEGAVFTGEGER